MGAAAVTTPLFRSEETKADAQGKRIWKESEKFVSRSAIAWERQSLALFTKESKAVTNGWKSGGEAGAVNAVDDEAWLEYISRLWLAVVPPAGTMAAEFLTDVKATSAALTDLMMTAAKEWLRLNGVRESRQITNASRRNISEQIRIGMQKGETDEQIAQRLMKRYKSLSPARAQTIAWTETHAATNYGSYSAARVSGESLAKIWLANADDRVREEHEDASGQKRSLDQPFTVDGEHLMFPGDSSMGASARLVVNCRCFIQYARMRRTVPVKPRRRRIAA